MNAAQQTTRLAKGYINKKLARCLLNNDLLVLIHLQTGDRGQDTESDGQYANVNLAGSQNLCQTIKQHGMGGR